MIRCKWCHSQVAGDTLRCPICAGNLYSERTLERERRLQRESLGKQRKRIGSQVFAAVGGAVRQRGYRLDNASPRECEYAENELGWRWRASHHIEVGRERRRFGFVLYVLLHPSHEPLQGPVNHHALPGSLVANVPPPWPLEASHFFLHLPVSATPFAETETLSFEELQWRLETMFLAIDWVALPCPFNDWWLISLPYSQVMPGQEP